MQFDYMYYNGDLVVNSGTEVKQKSPKICVVLYVFYSTTSIANW